jgi:hypothetical protein
MCIFKTYVHMLHDTRYCAPANPYLVTSVYDHYNPLMDRNEERSQLNVLERKAELEKQKEKEMLEKLQ